MGNCNVNARSTEAEPANPLINAVSPNARHTHFEVLVQHRLTIGVVHYAQETLCRSRTLPAPAPQGKHCWPHRDARTHRHHEAGNTVANA